MIFSARANTLICLIDQAAHERTLLERQISATDREIDRLVHGLTEEEIKIVENVT